MLSGMWVRYGAQLELVKYDPTIMFACVFAFYSFRAFFTFLFGRASCTTSRFYITVYFGLHFHSLWAFPSAHHLLSSRHFILVI